MPSNAKGLASSQAAKSHPIGEADAETVAYFRELFKGVAPEFAADLTRTIALKTASALAQNLPATLSRKAQAGGANDTSGERQAHVRPVTAVATPTGVSYEGFARLAGRMFMFAAEARASLHGAPVVTVTALRPLGKSAQVSGLKGQIQSLLPQIADAAESILLGIPPNSGIDMHKISVKVMSSIMDIINEHGIGVIPGSKAAQEYSTGPKRQEDGYSWVIAFDDQSAFAIDFPTSVYRKPQLVPPERVRVREIDRRDLDGVLG
jgi:hypothetical protein